MSTYNNITVLLNQPHLIVSFMVSYQTGSRLPRVSDPSLLHLPVGAGALLVAAETHRLINTTRVCQEQGRETAAVGRNDD